MQSVFVGGLQRSGTSLMRSLLNSLPEIELFPTDLPLWTAYYQQFRGKSIDNQETLDLLLNVIKQNSKAQIEPSLDWKEIREICLARTGLDCGDVFEIILRNYAERKNPSCKIWGLKSPGLEFSADAILTKHPEAKILQLVRDPRDVGTSLKNADWVHNFDILAHCDRWKRSVQLANQLESRYPERYMAIRYEDLVNHPQEEVTKVFSFLQIPFGISNIRDTLVLEGYSGNSSFGDAWSGVSSSAIGRFRQHLPLKDSFLYQTRARSEMEQWKYYPEEVSPGQEIIFSAREKLLLLRSKTEAAKYILRTVWNKVKQVLSLLLSSRQTQMEDTDLLKRTSSREG